ncbi:MAG: cyanoexosortase A [Cyanobacteria bacterium P01_A01_bin.45]
MKAKNNTIKPSITTEGLKKLRHPEYLLLGIGTGAIAIHMTLVWKSGNSSLLGTSFLFWMAVCSLIWERRDKLNLTSDLFSSLIGISLIALLLLKSLAMNSFAGFLYISPFLYGLSIGLLASGWRGIKQYSGELLALLSLGAPTLLPFWIKNIAPLTAKMSAFMLWYTGFDVERHGVYIYLPGGSIEVASGCSGIELIFQMLGLSLIFLIMFPQKWQQKIILPTVAALLGFLVNGVRVAVMAVLVANSNGAAKVLEYWHHGDGSLIFSTICVSLFGLFCWCILNQSETNNQNTKSSSR